MFCRNVITHIYTKMPSHLTQMLKEAALQISAKWWKLLPTKILLTELFIISLSVLFKKELPATHPPTPGKFLITVLLIFFAFPQVLACFYLKNAVTHLTDLVSIFPLATVKCSVKSSNFIACIFSVFTLCFILFL